MTVLAQISAFKKSFEDYLNQLTAAHRTEFSGVYQAMRYSLLMGGKRLRPFMMQQFYRLNGGQDDAFLNFAAALEMIHTYSLIHDDLPCMDNDELRRGKPSCHAAFGEATALLAGDALLTLAFETAAKTTKVPAERALKAMALLGECAGASGMIGGQMVDLLGEEKPLSLSEVELMYREKTGALLRAAAGIGTLLAGGDEIALKAAFSYANALGMAFQIQDDLLDITGNTETLGKPVGSDEKNNKNTFVALCGVSDAKAAMMNYTDAAKAALRSFGESAATLNELADVLVQRTF